MPQEFTAGRMFDRALGSVLGLVTGDALGSTVEFKSPEEIVQLFGPAGQTEMRGGGVFGWQVGQYTDDGQMMVCLLESLVASNATTLDGLDINDLGRRFLAWYDSGPPDMGLTTRRALARLKAGVPPDHSGDPEPDSQANGAVMRCAPVALLWHHPQHRDRLIRDSLLSAYPTHRSPVAAGACVVANVMIAEFIHGADFQAAFSAARQAANHEWRELLDEWDRAGRPQRGNSGWAVSTLLTALHCLETTDTFEAAVIKAVNGGHDADTVGAVTGQLAGAFYGAAAIPARWLAVLQDRTKITELACKLYNLAIP